jgi:hypothetical protein
MPPSTTNSNWNWNPKMSIIMPLGPFARTKANKLGARPVFVRQQQRVKLVCMRLLGQASDKQHGYRSRQDNAVAFHAAHANCMDMLSLIACF